MFYAAEEAPSADAHGSIATEPRRPERRPGGQGYGGRGVESLFTDDPILPGVTSVRAVHLTELRTRVGHLQFAGGAGKIA